VLHALCSTGCHGAGAHPVSDLRRLVARLRRAPIRHVLRGGRHATVTVGADDVLRLLRAGDMEPGFMRRIPGAVRAALAGITRPLVRLKLARAANRDKQSIADLNPAVNAVTTCEESTLAWDPAASPDVRRMQALAALDATPAATLDPFDRPAALTLGLLRQCGRWPPRERVVVEPGAGHFALSHGYYGCTDPAVRAFLEGRPRRPAGIRTTVSEAARWRDRGRAPGSWRRCGSGGRCP
jgi:hypothetical protein